MNIALKKPLRLIVIEDAEPDAILLVRDLQQHGYEVHYRQVKSARALEQALESGTWDLIISDFSLPGFSGLKALEMVKQRRIDVPFLMMSGIITEEMAVEALNAGANDFFQKGKFARLIPAIERELREAEKRRSHREVERQLHSSEERFIKSFQSNPLAIMICTLQDEIFVDVNPRFLDLLRYSREAVIGRTVDEVHLWFSDDDHSRMRQYLTKHSQVQDLEMQCCTSDGERKDVLVSIESIDLNGEPCTLAMIVDITERKRIERAEREQRVLAEALRDTALALSSTLELSEVLDLILENLVKVITYDAANIILSQADTVRIVRSSGYVFSSLVNQPLSPDNFPALKTILETRRPLLIPDTRIYPDWYSIFPNITVLSYIGVPILARDQILGVLNLYSFSPSFFNEQHLARLDVFGTQAAIAIQNAQLYQRAHELAAMQERQRLSHDLHDAVSQMLFTSSIISEALPGLAKRAPEKVWPQLEQIKRLNRGALAEMRKLLLELRSESIGDMDIQQLLEQLAQAVMGHTLLGVTLEINIQHSLAGNRKEMLYRITQEALNNIVKHARASQVTVVLTVTFDHGVLTVKDNGVGFVIGERMPGHLGLSIMQKRAEAVGALFSVESAPGQGTCITVAWEDHR